MYFQINIDYIITQSRNHTTITFNEKIYVTCYRLKPTRYLENSYIFFKYSIIIFHLENNKKHW